MTDSRPVVVQQEIPYYEYQRQLRTEKISYYESWLGEDELALVSEVIRDNWISEGPKTREFEERLASRFQVKHALAVSNATAGLIIALKALGVGPGDEVIAPTFTFIASINTIRLAGAEPVLVDVDPKTFTIDPDAAEAAIGPRTKAIMPVHIYGHAANMDRLMPLAQRHGLAVIEDTAQGMGVAFGGKPVGSFGNVAVVSFFADKAITLGEGGLILTSDDQMFRELLMLKNDGRLERGIYFHDRIGYNFRITDLQAAVGLGQLKKLDMIIERKRRNEQLYRQYLGGVSGIEFPYRDPRCFVVPHRTNIMVDDPEALLRYMAERKIGCRRFYVPVHMQPCYDLPKTFPVAERLHARGFSLPSGPTLPDDRVEYVAAQVRSFFEQV